MTGPPVNLVVVGAGPAGSGLAARTASRGARVVLLDERAFPRSKPCGDCLSPGATPLLAELGVLAKLRRETVAELDGWRLRAPGGRWFEGRFRRDDASRPVRGLALPRRQLDAALLEAASHSGAEIREGLRVVGLLRDAGRVTGVRVRDRSGRETSLSARLVAGADGLRSTVARRIGGVRSGARRRLALVARYEEGDSPGAGPTLGEMRISPEGCSGLAPLGGGRWNVTVVVPATEAGAIAADREGFLADRLRAYGVAGRLADARRTGQVEITGPFELTPRRAACDGAFLVGDAAGYFDPFTGQGICRALATGRLAAAHVIRTLGAATIVAERASRSRYVRELEALLGPARRTQRLIDLVVGRPALIDLAAWLLARRPGLTDLLVDVTGDLEPPAALADPRRLAAALAGRVRTASAGTAGRPGPAIRPFSRSRDLERRDARA